MAEADITSQNWRSNLLQWAVMAAAGAFLCFSILELAFVQVSKMAILGVAVLVSLLTARFDLHIPGTRATFHPKTVFVFWGTVLLGIFGGVLLALTSALSRSKEEGRDRESIRFDASRDIVCAFASAVAFHLSVQSFGDPQNTVVAGSFLIPNEVVFAACVMALVHFGVGAAVDILKAKVGESYRRLDTERLLWEPAVSHLVSLAVAIVLFLTFNHFGIEFGLVLLPIAVATNAAYRIHIRSLDQKTREILESSRIHLATVEALATAIDARDQVGVGHVRRTQIYAVGLGRMMNLSDGELDALRTAALLHDIGKLAVPDHILNKPGRLSQAEMEKTKIHSSVGASILEKVGFPNPVVPTVKYHHEFWDGSGYPEGLRGSQIPLTARILAVADAFDTLRGARPYRPAISREDACSFMRAGSGSQFDPKIVDLLIRNLRTFEDVIAGEGLQYDSESEAVSFTGSATTYVEQIKQANREVFTLYSLAREFGAAMSLEATLALFSQKVGDFVPYDACAVFLMDDTREFATAAHVAGPRSDLLVGKRIKVGEGATGYALKKNKTVENVDPALDLLFNVPDGELEFTTMATRPLVADGKVIGAISLYSGKVERYQDEHLRLLETISKIAADAIAKSQLHAEAATHAMTDPITGLPNARALHLEFDKEVKRAARSDSSFQLLMLDLDGFKAVNDNFGHKVGDRLLTALGGVIRNELRDYDFLARYAGDEFVALIPDTDASSVTELCRRIEAAVDGFGIEVSPGEVARVGVSIGSAAYPAQGESFDQLIISADKAMYVEKASRKLRKAVPAEQVNVAALLAPPPTAEEYVPPTSKGAGEEQMHGPHISGEMLVVELDETHVIATSSVN